MFESCDRGTYFRYTLLAFGLIVVPLLLVQLGVLVWARDNVAIGLIGLIGVFLLTIATVKRLVGMGLSRWLGLLVLLPYGLNLAFVAYLLLSTRRSLTGPAGIPGGDLRTARSIAEPMHRNRPDWTWVLVPVVSVVLVAALLFYAIRIDN